MRATLTTYDVHMARWTVFALVVLAGCGGHQSARDEPTRRDAEPRVAAPDAGMPAGHDGEPGRVRVPASDASAPEAVLRLAGIQASSGGAAPAPVRLTAPVLQPIA